MVEESNYCNCVKKKSILDSFRFLGSSLDSLVENLGGNNFKHLNREFDCEVLDLVKQKGYYPIEYKCNFEKFDEMLLSKNEFYSSLSGKVISDKGYQNVVKVWNEFEMKTRKDYHDFYLKCDVLSLADVSQKSRNRCLKDYGLYTGHYLRGPALSWDAMLSVTKVKLDLISDVDMYLLFEN